MATPPLSPVERAHQECLAAEAIYQKLTENPDYSDTGRTMMMMKASDDLQEKKKVWETLKANEATDAASFITELKAAGHTREEIESRLPSWVDLVNARNAEPHESIKLDITKTTLKLAELKAELKKLKKGKDQSEKARVEKDIEITEGNILALKGKLADSPKPAHKLTMSEATAELNRVFPKEKPKSAQGEKMFALREDGLHYVPVINDQPVGVEGIFICGPLCAIAYARTSDDEAWSLQLRFKNRDGQSKEFLLRIGDLETPGSTWLADLMNAGLVVGDEPEANGLLKRWLKSRKPEKRIRLVDRIGWHRSADGAEVFMLPTGPVPKPADNAEQYVFKDQGRKQQQYFATKGTLAEWRDNVGKLCVENSRLILTVAGAFLGPLLPLLGISGMGFHFFGDTSAGKSTALIVGGSVNGGSNRDLGFVQTWSTTANAMEALCESHNHTAMFADELALTNAQTLAQLTYVVAGGEGKARLDRNSNLRAVRRWLLVLFSNGELTSEMHMKSAGHGQTIRGGQEIRLMMVPGDAEAGFGVFETLPKEIADIQGLSNVERGAMFSKMLKINAHNFYGTALEAWVSALAARREPILEKAHEVMTKFRERYAESASTSPQIGRALDSFAAVAAAGECSQEITGWEADTAFNGVGLCFEAWLRDFGTEGSSDAKRGLENVRAFIQKHRESRFQNVSGKRAEVRIIDKEEQEVEVYDDRKQNLAGWKQDDGSWFYFTPAGFEEACGGISEKTTARELHRLKLLDGTTVDKKHLYQKRESIKALPVKDGKIPRAWVYAISAEILGQVDDGSEAVASVPGPDVKQLSLLRDGNTDEEAAKHGVPKVAREWAA